MKVKSLITSSSNSSTKSQVLVDCGAVQADALTVDRLASLEKVHFYNYSEPFFFANIIAMLFCINICSFPIFTAQDLPFLLFFPLNLLFNLGIQYHQTAVVPRDSILATEVEWLNSIKADLVVNIYASVLNSIYDAALLSRKYNMCFTYVL